MRLADLQAGFRGYLFGTPKAAVDYALDRAIVPDRPGAAARLAIYRNHVRLSLTAALAATYQVVARLVGEAFFADVARAYIGGTPPLQPVLSEYGEGFAARLSADPRLQSMPWIADVAHLEWLLNVAFHCERHPPLCPADLAAIAPEAAAELRLSLQPGTAILRSPWPVDRIWLANQPPADGSGVDIDAGAVDLLVMRRDSDAAFLSLAAGEAAFLAALDAGQRLEDAVLSAAAETGHFPLAASLARFLSLGIFAQLM